VTKRRLLVAAAVAAVLVLPAALAEARRAPARLFVTGDEWSLVLSRSSIRSGKAVIQFQNRGEDPHDLRIRRIGGVDPLRVMGVSETEPSALQALKVRLAPGRYRLWCSLPGHRAKGMRAVLRVRRAR
jgi:hypothetical protein